MLKAPRFPASGRSFQVELKNRVDAYFEQHNLSITGNTKLYLKTLFICLSFALTYTLLVFFNPGVIPSVLLSVLLGIEIAAIGFNIMHDGAHGSFAENGAINQMAASSLDFLGASSFMWKVKHNIAHHTYTNIPEFDDDIDVRPWLRMAKSQKRHFFHRFQHFYFIFLYSLLLVFWVGYRDFKKYFTGKVGNTPIKDMSWKDHLGFWASKVSFVIMFVALPLYMKGTVPYLIGFFIFTSVSSVILSVVFQLAHVVEEMDFPTPDVTSNKMEDEWAVHQVKTTANFATQSKLVTWFTGGLNHQIEHHLFPRVSHVHYPALRKIVKQTTAEFGLPYLEFSGVGTAVYAHVIHLKKMGISEN